MREAVVHKKNEQFILSVMRAYINKVRENAKNNPKEAREHAEKALRRTGVIDQDGKQKDTIVSWE